jgi:endoglucanase
MLRTVCVILFFLITNVYGHTQGFLRARGKVIVNGRNEEVLLRGMGLGGWMLQEPYMVEMGGVAEAQHAIRKRIETTIGKERTQQFYDAWLANHCTKADIDSMAAWGYNSVRLPMHYNLFTLSIEEEKTPGQHTWLQKGFTLTDSLLQWCKANKIYLILDLHAAPGGQGTDIPISDRDKTKPSLWQSAANREKTIALWRKLAERYAREEWIGGYDLINETNWGFQDSTDRNGCGEKENKELKELLTGITKAIREVDKNHLIFIEGNCWANNYGGLFPLWDNNMAVSFHKYWNYNDQDAVSKFVQIREEQNVPLWMGESGENSNSWFTDAISLLERNNIGWAWWPLKKLGANNPLQIKIGRFRELLDDWREPGEKIKPDEAFEILMELANAARIENNIVRRDVTDAMFRQVRSAEAIPFVRRTLKDTLTIFASDYDLGRSGVAYHDKDSANYWVSNQQRTQWNRGFRYRNDGVDIRSVDVPDANGYAVGWTEDGEWMQYTLNVPKAGWYELSFLASNDSSGVFAVSVNGKEMGEKIVLKGKTQWRTIRTTKPLYLQEGVNRLRFHVVKGGFSIASMKLRRTKK